MMKKIYVCSPLAGDIHNNIERAKEYARFVVKECGAIPIAPHIYFTQFLDDTVQEDRNFGTEVGLLLLSDCDELWYFGDQISRGMTDEICYALEHKIPVKYIHEYNYEIYIKERNQVYEME